MKRVLTAVVLASVVVYLTLIALNPIFYSVLGMVALWAANEYFGLARRVCQETPARLMLGIFLVTVLVNVGATFSWSGFDLVINLLFLDLAILVLSPFVLIIHGFVNSDLKQTFVGSGLAYLVLPLVFFPLGFLGLIRNAIQGPLLVLFLFTVVWSGDIAAYYVGKNLGRHPLAPSISPKKTWEGAFASAIGASAVGVIFVAVCNSYVPSLVRDISLFQLEGVRWVEAVLVGLLLNVAAQFGDLVESAFKRAADVKDSGSILPGHGGILDRIDALLFASPLMWMYVMIIMKHNPPPTFSM